MSKQVEFISSLILNTSLTQSPNASLWFNSYLGGFFYLEDGFKWAQYGNKYTHQIYKDGNIEFSEELKSEHRFSVSWSYKYIQIKHTVTFLSAILALYSGPSAQVYTSGLLSKKFSISNATRQGCPVSPSIFNLIIETLAEAIRANPLISGFRLCGTHHVINLFTDDVILLTNPLVSLPAAHQVLTNFSTIPYYKVNFTKSLILDLGIYKTTRRNLINHTLFLG